jgi:hypothetical protein
MAKSSQPANELPREFEYLSLHGARGRFFLFVHQSFVCCVLYGFRVRKRERERR